MNRNYLNQVKRKNIRIGESNPDEKKTRGDSFNSS